MPPPSEPSQAQGPRQPPQAGWTPLLDHLPVAAFLAGEDGRWLQANGAAARTLGLDREVLLGGNIFDPRTRMLSEEGAVVLPEDTPTVRALRTGTPQAGRLLGWIKADGRTQWLQVSADPVPGIGVLTVLEDVTGRRATEAVLAARNRIVELAVHGTLSEILTATLDEAERLTGSCIGFYHFVDPDQTSLTLQAWSTRTSRDFCRAEGAGLHYPLAEAGVWTEAVKTRAPVIHNDYASLPNRRGMPPGHAEVVRELVVPVFRGGDLVAILGVGNKPYDYVEQDIDLIQKLAELAWDVAERRRAQAALREAEERWHTMVEQAGDGFELTDEEGRLVDVNEATCRHTGYSREELLGMTIFQLDQDLDPAFYRANFPGPLEGGPVRLERTHRAKDGSVYPVEVSFSGVQIAGRHRSLSLVRDITERRKAEAALRTSETRLRDAQDLARIGHWVQDHRTGEVVWSEALYRVHGLDPTAGPPDWDGFRALIHPDDRERVAAGFALAQLPGTPTYTAEYRTLGPDGILRHLRVHIRTEFDGKGRPALSFGTDQDITEQVAAREALRESEWRLAALMANLPGMVYRCANTPDWPMEFCSEGALSLTGHSPADLITNRPAFGDLILPEDRDMVWEGVQGGLREGRPYELNYRIRTAGGAVKHVWERGGGAVDREGRLRYLEGFITDVTERHRAEEQRQAMEQQVARAQKMESLGSLAGGVAHDMNNVLGAILALASLHEKQVPEGTPLHRSMLTISKACVRGRAMVQGLLGFARQGLTEERVLDLNELIREQAALLSRTTLQRVRLELDLAEDLKPVLGDPAALSHALMNLAVNAVDAMPGGGLLRLRTRNLGADRVEVAVQDTGEGMSPEVLARATDPFYTTKPQGQGTGLGLAIVYGAMKAHHGRLDLESTPGAGTTAILTFPACEPEAAVPAPAPAHAPHGGGLRVLVVDDDELLQASLASLLEAMGHRQATVGSGEEALRMLREGHAFDAVILDINMPGLGGAATLPQLRALRPGLKVLVSTGRPTQDVLDLVEGTPGVALLPKPFGVEDLRRQLGGPAGT